MEARDSAILVAALFALTFVSGVVDAVSFLALGHVFTANITGNVVLLGFAMVPEVRLSLPRSAIALACFFLGAMGGGRLEAWMARATRARWIASAFSAEAALLAAAAIIAWGAGSPMSGRPRAYADVALLAFAMGLRNATVRKLRMRDLTTTVVTLTLADFGRRVALGAARSGRWERPLGSVVMMLCGAVAGALLLRASITAALAVASAIAAACAAAVAISDASSSAPSPPALPPRRP